MKGQLFLSFLLIAAPLSGIAEQLVPAGSIIQCTVNEPKISSATEKVGDPVLCQLSNIELYGRFTVPYGTYLVGRFEEYKDPGHLFGKGWMELRFDRIVIQPDTVIPMDARVVSVPKYSVDREGRIHGNGHPVRDTIEWMIPVLWPIDLINLPRRGPRPVLKPETKLTLKVMDDFAMPTRQELHQQQLQDELDQRRLLSRNDPAPAYNPPAPVQESYAPPQPAYNPPPRPAYQPQPAYPYPVQPVYYAQPVMMASPVIVQQQPVVVQQPPIIVQRPMVRYMPPPPYAYGMRMSYYGPY